MPEPDRKARTKILAAMGSGAHRTVDIALHIGICATAVGYMLDAMRKDAIVVRNASGLWRATGKPLPKQVTPVEKRRPAKCVSERPRADFTITALDEALRGWPKHSPQG